jgi:aldose 1-epimerase
VSRPVSGEQFTIHRDRLRAQIGQLAAVLRGFTADGVPLTESWADDVISPMGCGLVLVPWPNRVRAGRWELDGKAQQLDLTEPSRGNAIHGLLRNTAYTAVERRESAVTLAASIYPQHGYPFTLDTSVHYELTDEGLRVTHRLTNAGGAAAPFGIGAHPYLRVGAADVNTLRLTVPASTVVQVDEALVPTGTAAVSAADGNDLRSGVLVGDVALDNNFTDLEVTDGQVRARLEDPATGHGVQWWAEDAFRFVQVYNPPNFPDPAGPRRALALEPMTCGVDALNTGAGLRWLQPGETFAASWGLSPLGF